MESFPFFLFWPRQCGDQGSTMGPLYRKHDVLTLGPPGKKIPEMESSESSALVMENIQGNIRDPSPKPW